MYVCVTLNDIYKVLINYKYIVSVSLRALYIVYIVFESPGEKHAGGCFDLVMYKYIDSFALKAYYTVYFMF